MHVRFVTQRRGDKTYRYPQLVESYRRPDGMPAHRVIATLTGMTDLELANLRVGLAAARTNSEVVVASEVRTRPAPAVVANLDYLDVAVVLQVWRDLGLPKLLGEAMGRTGAAVDAAEVVAALAIHRLIAPGSKLAAHRWFPKTALPLLMGLPEASFNNTRVHRALAALDRSETRLQERLPGAVAPEGGFTALFLDTTDTWFEGRGAPMVQKGLTKEGLYRRRVGIALMCDSHGLPVRWRALPGRYRDDLVMNEMCAELSAVPWIGTAPVVMDRAMGRAKSVETLAEGTLRFVTALPVDEFASYSERIPAGLFNDVDLDDARAQEALARCARVAGFERVRADRYVLDLGVVEKGDGNREKGRRHRRPALSQARASMALARTFGALREGGATLDTIAKAHGMAEAGVRRLLALLRLDDALQERVLAGELDAAMLKDLSRLSSLSAETQAPAFDRLVASLAGQAPRAAHARRQPEALPPIRVRMVLQFNPERFVEQRRTTSARLGELHAHVERTNAALAAPRSRRQPAPVQREVESLAERYKLLDVVSVRVSKRADGAASAVSLTVDTSKAAERQRFDGLNVIVAHRDIPHSGPELVALYFAKDAVEKDFQIIKSELELRPVRHRTDPKVRAHVSVCMLALLAARSLQTRLAAAGMPTTAAAACERLATCHLNVFGSKNRPIWNLTQLTPEQERMLDALGMPHLAKLDGLTTDCA